MRNDFYELRNRCNIFFKKVGKGPASPESQFAAIVNFSVPLWRESLSFTGQTLGITYIFISLQGEITAWQAAHWQG